MFQVLHCRSSKDVISNGYLIPAGTLVVANHWYIANDPDVLNFQNPEVFGSQRWIDASGNIKFCTCGFGQRACAGQYIANRSIFITIALLQNPASHMDIFGFPDTVAVIQTPSRQFSNHV